MNELEKREKEIQKNKEEIIKLISQTPHPSGNLLTIILELLLRDDSYVDYNLEGFENYKQLDLTIKYL